MIQLVFVSLFFLNCFSFFLSFLHSSQESSLRPDVVILGAAAVSCALTLVMLLLLLLVNSHVCSLFSLSSPLLPSLQWSIKQHGGSSEALRQYRLNLTAMAAPLQRLADHSEVYWLLQGEAAWP